MNTCTEIPTLWLVFHFSCWHFRSELNVVLSFVAHPLFNPKWKYLRTRWPPLLCPLPYYNIQNPRDPETTVLFRYSVWDVFFLRGNVRCGVGKAPELPILTCTTFTGNGNIHTWTIPLWAKTGGQRFRGTGFDGHWKTGVSRFSWCIAGCVPRLINREKPS